MLRQQCRFANACRAKKEQPARLRQAREWHSTPCVCLLQVWMSDNMLFEFSKFRSICLVIYSTGASRECCKALFRTLGISQLLCSHQSYSS